MMRETAESATSAAQIFLGAAEQARDAETAAYWALAAERSARTALALVQAVKTAENAGRRS